MLHSARRDRAQRKVAPVSSETFDLVVVGAGAAGMAAAALAAAEGMCVLLLEHAAQVGGTTAISGGMVWIPANRKMAAAGREDSLDAARTYLAHTMAAPSDAAPLEAFLTHGDDAIATLERQTALRLQPVLNYPDYEPDLPGATVGGRVLEPVPFNARALGKDFALLRAPLPEFTLFGGMMIARPDIPHLRRAARSPFSAWHVARLLARHARERLHAPRGSSLVLGNALAGWLLHSVRERGVELRTGATVRRLLFDAGRVTGVEFEHAGLRRQALAARGVVLASGGLSHDAALRARFVPPAAGTLSATVGDASATSGGALAAALGARLSGNGQRRAFWVPASQYVRGDGSQAVYPHTVADRAKPGLIAVNRHGRRFANEARSYHAFVRAQLDADAVPAWLVCDRHFLWRYGLGAVKPFAWTLGGFVRSGYLHRADTLDALARSLGLPADAFADTVHRFNIDARQGRDPAFGRGGDIYQRHLGDAEHRPNPCVAAIEVAPFYAVEVRPADLGMAAGLVTDATARVLGADGAPIAGLYACGNDMQSVMNGAYPGPGITLGPALVFAVLAVRDAMRG